MMEAISRVGDPGGVYPDPDRTLKKTTRIRPINTRYFFFEFKSINDI